jgi:type II secretory pathway pseudopilin PulG
LAKSSCNAKSESGFTLLEVCIATGLLIAAVVSLAQMFALATRTNTMARKTTYATVLAEQKVEELRALTWGFDSSGVPISDTTTNTSVVPEQPNGGVGLTPSPADALRQNTPGYVDFLDQFGNKLDAPAGQPPDGTIYIRRWSIEPLPTNPNNTLIIQVLATRFRNRGADNDAGKVRRLPEEARVITVKTRKAQ